MERRKLFSENNVKPVRRKLFSDDCPVSDIEKQLHTVICIDCGYKMDTTASTTDLICPRCGGTSFVPESDTVVDPIQLPEHNTEEKTYSDTKKRRKLFSTYEEDEAEFQREFSEPTSELQSKLKEFSGRVLSQSEYQKEFSDLADLDELQERGYSEPCDGGIKISDTAFQESKLFSEIVLSITKELHLDPAILCCKHNKEEIIDRLSERDDDFSPKCIALLKKAHNIPTEKHDEEWLKDSGILGDIEIEFGGQHKDTPEFKEIIDTRYPDAPEDIMEILKRKGIIRENGNTIEILNNN